MDKSLRQKRLVEAVAYLNIIGGSFIIYIVGSVIIGELESALLSVGLVSLITGITMCMHNKSVVFGTLKD